jgi:hypothetical protein
MSFKVLALEIDEILRRVRQGTDFPYGRGDEAMVRSANAAAKSLGLPEPFDLELSESHVYLGIRDFSTGELVGSVTALQPIAPVAVAPPIHIHDKALRDVPQGLVDALMDWRHMIAREQCIDEERQAAPEYPEPQRTLTPRQEQIRQALLERSHGRGLAWGMTAEELRRALERAGIEPPQAPSISKDMQAIRDAGCPYTTGRRGYRLLACSEIALGKALAGRDGK